MSLGGVTASLAALGIIAALNKWRQLKLGALARRGGVAAAALGLFQ